MKHLAGTRLVRCVLVAVAAILGGMACAAIAAEPRSLRVYFVGNSVTDTINYLGLEQLATGRGHRHVWGRHMIPGAPLEWIWNHPDQGFQQAPFGHYPQALRDHPWDALCLQPFDRHLEGQDGDVATAGRFVRLALGRSPDLQLYIYARWPRRDEDGSLDYDRLWRRPYTGHWDGSNETDDYFRRLVEQLRRELPELNKPVLMVPVGHVMHRLDQLAQAGQVPGLPRVTELYQDQIHLRPLGSYLVACTFYATLHAQTPVDLPWEPYGDFDPPLAQAIQRIVWEVVANHPWSGVAEREEEQPAAPESRDARHRRLVVGTWEDDYQGKRTMTLREDGTGTMVVELRGVTATLFASRLQFDMEWSLENGRLKKRTVGGTPEARVNMILRMMGDRVDEPILELTEDQLLLLDQDDKTRYDWRRVR